MEETGNKRETSKAVEHHPETLIDLPADPADALADLSVAPEQAEATTAGTNHSGSILVALGDASVRAVR